MQSLLTSWWRRAPRHKQPWHWPGSCRTLQAQYQRELFASNILMSNSGRKDRGICAQVCKMTARGDLSHKFTKFYHFNTCSCTKYYTTVDLLIYILLSIHWYLETHIIPGNFSQTLETHTICGCKVTLVPVLGFIYKKLEAKNGFQIF